MKTKLHSTITLFVILVFLAIITRLLMVTQEAAVNQNLILNLPDSDILGFEIIKTEPNQKLEKLVVHKDSENNWVIIAPVEDITDPGIISIMLASLKGIRTPTIIKNVTDLSEYGLDRPIVSVNINLKKGKKATLNFGSESPIPEMFYAQVNGRSEVVVLGKDIKNNLSPKLSYLRERKVVNIMSAQVQMLTIHINRDQIYRMNNSNGKWSLTEPYPKEPIDNSIHAIIDGLNALWTHENLDELNNLAQYGLDQPKYRIEFELYDGKKFSLIANQVNGDYYMLNSLRPTIFIQKNPDAFNFLEISLHDLQN